MSKVISLKVEEFLVKSKDNLIVDVRSPAEFEHAHIPGAVNFYLFDNDERKEIGTLYKQHGREKAMMRGLELYGNNMKRIVEQVQQSGHKKLFVHCWRGGMRSGVVSWMLSLFGHHVSVLQGGYKMYRRFVLDSFQQQYSFVIVGGKTGSAKTKVIHQLQSQDEAVIDLEGLANHRGSAFGAIGLPAPPTQEQFENNLAKQLLQLQSKKIFLEDESQRIGWVNIPNNIWLQMRDSKVLYLDIPFEERLKYLVSTYGLFPVEELKAASERIRKRLGGLDLKNTLQYLNDGNFIEAFRILLKYYDKVYQHATDNRKALNVLTISCTDVDEIKNAEAIIQQKI